MQLHGKWFERGRTTSCEATLNISGEQFRVLTSQGEASNGLITQISVSDRLGKLERKLQLPDGSLFATTDNNAVDQAFAKVSSNIGLIHKIESSWKWVAIAVILTMATTFAFFRWGLPWVTHSVAHALPHSTGEIIGENTLEFLDGYIFDASQLKKAQQKRIRKHFDTTLVPTHQVDAEISYTLHFRAWGEGEDGIPNALALPSGDIILTDRFVELSANQDEIDAVLLHEMGHVEHRHTLEMVTQSTLVAVILAVFTGDVSGAGDMGVGLGSLLVTTGYSRRFESEADEFAFEHMLKAGIDPTAFATIMDKITRFDEDREEDNEEGQEERLEANIETSESPNTRDKSDNSGWIDYLSTHPNTQERIAKAKLYAQCYKDGLLDCTAVLHATD